ncbi:MAG: class II aldolase/adducin family protein [Acidilobaceae archaeon]
MILGEEKATIVADTIRLLYLRGLTQIKGGNVSFIDRSNGLIYITPSKLPKHNIKPEDIAVIDINSRILRGNPSIEYMMHLEIYKSIDEAQAVVHAHPPYTLSAIEAKLNLDTSILMEAKYKIKCITIVPPLEPGSRDLAVATAKALAESKCNIAILYRHGIIAYSSIDPYDALDTIEALEDLAKITITIYNLKSLMLRVN